MDFSKLIENDLPIVSGRNVFLRSEYQKAAGIGQAFACVRLQRMQDEGRVRRVRTRRNGRLVQAWEYIPRKRKAAASE